MKTLFLAVILGWTSNVETNLTGYKLYQAGIPGIYTNVTALGLTNSVTLDLTNQGIYHFALSARNSLGQESDLSSEVIWTNIVASTNLPEVRIRMGWTNHTIYWTYNSNVCDRLEWGRDLKNWTEIGPGFMVMKNGNWEVSFSTLPTVRFFRVRRTWLCL